MAERAPRAVVVGGSLGGLTAALVLRDGGWDVDVYERAQRPLEGRGAGIVLHPVTARYLLERGGYELDALGPRSDAVRYLDAQGSVVSERPCGLRFASYGVLYEGLRRGFGSDHYRLGRELVSVSQDDDGVSAGFADGATVACDLLVCADGIRSTARSLLLPRCAPRYAGYVAWRGMAPIDTLSATAAMPAEGAFTFSLLPRSHILAYPVNGPDGRRFANWVWYRNVGAGDPLAALMTARDGTPREISLAPGEVGAAHLRELAEAADDLLPPPFAALVRETRERFVQAIVDIAVERMAFGRICLIGDAAFAVRPHAGAGTAKAADDAWSLADALSGAGGDIVAALRGWERARLALGRRLAKRTRTAGSRSQVLGTWRVGEPPPIGLHEVGDSEFG